MPHLHQLDIISLLNLSHSDGCIYWYLTEILICISLVTNDLLSIFSCVSWSFIYFALRGVCPNLLPVFN